VLIDCCLQAVTQRATSSSGGHNLRQYGMMYLQSAGIRVLNVKKTDE